MLDRWTLWDFVESRACVTPDALFAVDEVDRTLTFLDYRNGAERVAAGLTELGVGPGVRVAWQLPTWLESLVLIAALARVEAVQIPLLPIYRRREVEFVAGQAEPALLFVPPVWRGFDYPAMAHEVAAAHPDLDVVVVEDRRLPDGDPRRLGAPPAIPTTADDALVRWIFFTSGTTGSPKGALHTDLTIKAAALGFVTGLDLGPADVNALVFPLTHIGGPIQVMSCLMTGASLVTAEAFSARDTPQHLARHGVTLPGSGTPFHLAYLAAQREDPDHPLFPAARAFPGGGSPKPPELFHEIARELGGGRVVSSYGLTEAPILTSNLIGDSDEKLAATEGRATGGVELRVVTLDGAPAGPGEEGELQVRGPQLARGFLDPEQVAGSFLPDGFFRTGDLAVLDDEGYVTITGRLKDIIIRNGENISAKEVEDLIYTHPAVADVAVVGLPDPRSGERCCAILQLRPGADAPTLLELAAFCRDAGLMNQKIPEQLEILSDIPRNPSGKILKHELRRRYADAADAPVRG
jgi:cyclohexanecarboxylate-CoA ligase